MVEIIKKYFGFSTKEAKEYIKNADLKTLEAIKNNFEQNARKAFYND